MTEFESIPLELRLKIFANLDMHMILTCRLVSKLFLPNDVTVDLNLPPDCLQALITIYWSSNVRTDMNMNSAFVPAREIEITREVSNIGDIPASFVKNLHRLSILRAKGRNEEMEFLATQDGPENLEILCLFAVDAEIYTMIPTLICKQKDLHHVCIVSMAGAMYELGARKANKLDVEMTPEDFDCDWLKGPGCNQLTKFSSTKWNTKNLQSLPKSLQMLNHNSPVSLTDILWISENLVNLVILGIAIPDETATAPKQPWMLRNESTFSLTHLKKLIALPKLQKMMLDFGSDLKKDEFHKQKTRLEKLMDECRNVTGLKVLILSHQHLYRDEDEDDDDDTSGWVSSDDEDYSGNSAPSKPPSTGVKKAHLYYIGLIVEIDRSTFTGF